MKMLLIQCVVFVFFYIGKQCFENKTKSIISSLACVCISKHADQQITVGLSNDRGVSNIIMLMPHIKFLKNIDQYLKK